MRLVVPDAVNGKNVIRLYDNTTKLLSELNANDLIMGDDSEPRKILNLSVRKNITYEITQIYGDSYIASEIDILCLQLSKKPWMIEREERKSYCVLWIDEYKINSKSFSWKSIAKDLAYKNAEYFLKNLPVINKITISVKDYINNRTKGWRNAYKCYKSGVEYEKIDVVMKPYMLGLWLGDGTSAGPSITTVDPEIIDSIKSHYPTLKVSRVGKSITYGITSGHEGLRWAGKNIFLNQLKNLHLINNKHIPYEYLYNDRQSRLELLAGLIDTDGYQGTKMFEIVQKKKILADQILILARSLGFRANIVKSEKYCMHKGVKRTGTYYRVYISGFTSEVPVILERKKAGERLINKDPLCYGITVKSISEKYYYHIEVDGNKRYLLGDYTTVATV